MGILSILLTIILTINGVSCIKSNYNLALGQMRMEQPNLTFNDKLCESVKNRCHIDRKSSNLCQTEISSECGPCGFPAGKSVSFNSLKSDLTCHDALTPGVYHNQPGGIMLLSLLEDINKGAPKWTMCMDPSQNKPSLSDLLQTPCVGSDCSRQVLDFRVCALDSPGQEIKSDCFNKHTLQAFPRHKGVDQIYIEETFSCGHCVIETSNRGSYRSLSCFPIIIMPIRSQSKRIQIRSINSANRSVDKDDNANSTDESLASQTLSFNDSNALSTDEVIKITDPKALTKDEILNVTDSTGLSTHAINQTQELHTQDGSEHLNTNSNTSSSNHDSTEGPRTTIAKLEITTQVLKLNDSEIQEESVISLKVLNESVITNGSEVTEGIRGSTEGFNAEVEKIYPNGTGQERPSKIDGSLISDDEGTVRTNFAKVDTIISKALPKNETPTMKMVLQTAAITTEEFHGSSEQAMTSMSFEDEWKMHEKEAEKNEMDIQANLGNSSHATTEPDSPAEPDPFLALNDYTVPVARSQARLPDAIVLWSYSVLGLILVYGGKMILKASAETYEVLAKI